MSVYMLYTCTATLLVGEDIRHLVLNKPALLSAVSRAYVLAALANLNTAVSLVLLVRIVILIR